MIILPAIDLKDGKVVRLYKGEFETVHQVSDSPMDTARAFYEAGARWVHMVDLDGARDGVRKNGGIVAQVAAQSGLFVELGGGIRDMDDLRAVFALGVRRAVIGSSAVQNPAFVRAAVEQYGTCIAVGVDAKDGRVRTSGWTEDSGIDYLDFAAEMEKLGVRTIIFTDIDTDGLLTGPSYARLEALQARVSCQIIASGGVSSNEDLRRLRERGLYGAIVGKAYYTGDVELRAAIADAGVQD